MPLVVQNIDDDNDDVDVDGAWFPGMEASALCHWHFWAAGHGVDRLRQGEDESSHVFHNSNLVG